MSRVFIRGCGAVSPGGWGVQPLLEAIDSNTDLPVQTLAAPGQNFRIKNVPAPNPRPACLAHPRLRRASAISQYATAAAVEALANIDKSGKRLGIVVGVHAASIRYSERFFAEVLRDPGTASPLLFPETVINAPASHLAAALTSTALTYSVLGDQTAFVQALAIGAGWLATNRADLVLVIGAEESAWTVSASAHFFAREVICSEGAGALCLSRDSSPASVELTAITHPELFTETTRTQASERIATQFSAADNRLLCDSRTGSARWDSAENSAWKNWRGVRVSPRKNLGEGLSAATAWQFVAAVEKLRRGAAREAIVNCVGSNQQAIAATLAIVA